MDIVEQIERRHAALTQLPEGRTPEEDKRIDEEIERMVYSPENQALIRKIAFSDDEEEADRLRRQVIYLPDTFVANMLDDDGRDFIKEVGYKLDTVEMKYGKGWLDKKYP